MPTHPVDEDILDDDPTDELPVLGEDDLAAAADTGQFHTLERVDATARFPSLRSEHNGDDTIISLRSDLAERNARVESLEHDIDRLRNRWGDIETSLQQRDQLISGGRAAGEVGMNQLSHRRRPSGAGPRRRAG